MGRSFKKKACVAAAGLAAAILTPGALIAKDLTLSAGEYQKIDTAGKDLGRVVIGDSSVVDVVLDKQGNATIVALQPGESSVFLYEADGGVLKHHIEVVSDETGIVTVTEGAQSTKYRCYSKCAVE